MSLFFGHSTPVATAQAKPVQRPQSAVIARLGWSLLEEITDCCRSLSRACSHRPSSERRNLQCRRNPLLTGCPGSNPSRASLCTVTGCNRTNLLASLASTNGSRWVGAASVDTGMNHLERQRRMLTASRQCRIAPSLARGAKHVQYFVFFG